MIMPSPLDIQLSGQNASPEENPISPNMAAPLPSGNGVDGAADVAPASSTLGLSHPLRLSEERLQVRG